MKKEKEELTESAVEAQQPYTTKITSVDEGNGVVLAETNAPDGTGFTVSVNGRLTDGAAEGGQIWFFTGSPIEPFSAVALK
ncbi:hypothetical protein [Arsenicibacter rosenii]|uniref:Uncharacterized protein n=1 Tax=Arsenicibacter rosenii TaxID=1750698 RepID=A0A1S2VCD3_9BACT|nr:hypothetical protein [Arsenicibacter rosenii]OIN55886.1 hypothetical protein BLX24_27920 [Arsenicibacter rosenii]